jgi:hypothetical protein
MKILWLTWMDWAGMRCKPQTQTWLFPSNLQGVTSGPWRKHAFATSAFLFAHTYLKEPSHLGHGVPGPYPAAVVSHKVTKVHSH